jgi:hypothetical protein
MNRGHVYAKDGAAADSEVDDFTRYMDAGMTAVDCADINPGMCV